MIKDWEILFNGVNSSTCYIQLCDKIYYSNEILCLIGNFNRMSYMQGNNFNLVINNFVLSQSDFNHIQREFVFKYKSYVIISDLRNFLSQI